MIELNDSLIKFHKDIDKISKTQTKALTNALNWCAFDARKEVQSELSEVFDSPTPFAQGSVFVRQAKPDNLLAKVDMARGRSRVNASWQYEDGLFAPHVFGGQRRYKRIETLLWRKGILAKNLQASIGKKTRVNRYGNLSRGMYTKILSNLNAHDERGFTANTAANKKRSIFVAKNKHGDPIGVWQRTSKKKVNSVLSFGKRAKYKKKLDFFGIIEKEINTNFERKYAKALRKEIARHLKF